MSDQNEVELPDIVYFQLASDKKSVNIGEQCDYYCNTTMTKKEFGRFVCKLNQLHAAMLDTSARSCLELDSILIITSN